MASKGTLKLGLIGMSSGNGHPYSWAAILNGYEPQLMAECGFPAIPQYLSEQSWPQARLDGARVTHVWTQSVRLSEKIARTTAIDEVVKSPENMIGHVDAVLLARDDAENHLMYARPFLEAGLPVYIDKPVALSMEGLRCLYSLQQYEGQIFTCSATRYARELRLTDEQREAIGEMRHIIAVTPNSWEKYVVHIVEPLLLLLREAPQIAGSRVTNIAQGGRTMTLRLKNGISVELTALGQAAPSPISLRVFGSKGWEELVFRNTFDAFKAALRDFIEGAKTRECRSSPEFNERVVSIIELGMGI